MEPCDATERRQREYKWCVLGRRPLIATVMRVILRSYDHLIKNS
jgi:hypothetical protein